MTDPIHPASGDLEAVQEIEMVSFDNGYSEPAPSMWRVVLSSYCADFPTKTAANNFHAAILSLRPAPPATVGEADHKAIGKALYARRDGNRSVEAAIARLAASGFQITRTGTTPASQPDVQE